MFRRQQKMDTNYFYISSTKWPYVFSCSIYVYLNVASWRWMWWQVIGDLPTQMTGSSSLRVPFDNEFSGSDGTFRKAGAPLLDKKNVCGRKCVCSFSRSRSLWRRVDWRKALRGGTRLKKATGRYHISSVSCWKLVHGSNLWLQTELRGCWNRMHSWQKKSVATFFDHMILIIMRPFCNE